MRCQSLKDMMVHNVIFLDMKVELKSQHILSTVSDAV